MQNRVTFAVAMHITDDQTFGSDEHARIHRVGQVVLDAGTPERQDFTIGQCGGEMRIELHLTYRQQQNGDVAVLGCARLYEGTQAASGPAEGQARLSGTVASGLTRTFSLSVRHPDDSGDCADLSVRVSNLALNEPDPCANIGAKAAALGLPWTGAPLSGCVPVRGGHRRRYQHCDLYASLATGVHALHGDIRRKYEARGGPMGSLGLPVTDETPTPDRTGRLSQFSGNGSIYWHPRTGPMEVRAAIRARWAQTGWERGAYGYPTSDELTIQTTPPQAYSEFQNGVIYVEDSAVVDPATAQLSGEQVRAVVEAACRRRTAHDPQLQIDSVVISGVSETSYDFLRSGNRVVTFRVCGAIHSGPWFVPEPAFELTLPLRFAASPQPDAHREVTLLVQQAGVIHLQASSAVYPDALEVAAALRASLITPFRTPLRLGRVAAVAGLLSFKVMKDGGLTLYFRPDVAGRFAAAAAQATLDSLQF